MFSFFKKKEAPVEENKTPVLTAYLSGKVIPIDEVKDEVFSSKALGDGLGIEPEGNVIVAPCAGTVSALMEGSKHAVGLTLSNGAEILIHEGIDTGYPRCGCGIQYTEYHQCYGRSTEKWREDSCVSGALCDRIHL